MFIPDAHFAPGIPLYAPDHAPTIQKNRLVNWSSGYPRA